MRQLAWLAFAISMSGCWKLQDAENQDDCQHALDIVCGCSSVDCTADPPPPIVATLRRCDQDEIITDTGDLAICIADAPRYCAILDDLRTSDPALCAETCHDDDACDLEQDCHAYQFASCS